jgi:hypothetical protein
VCDVAETCDGGSATCPADGFVAAGTECRGAADVCDVAETCDGGSAACPADGVAAAGSECRPAASACDFPESCDGAATGCPADVVQPADIVCRPAVDACDPEEVCDGTSGNCPADVHEDADGDLVCDADDLCPMDADASQDDADGDGRGDACDPCNNIVPVFATRARLLVKKLQAPPADEVLVFKGKMEIPTEPTIDPVANGVRVMVESNLLAAAPVLDAIVPGGEGWKANKKGTKWRYKSTTNPDGIRKIKMKLGRRNPVLKFTVKAKPGTFPVSEADLPLLGTFIVDSPMAMTGQCGEAEFPGTDKKNRCTLATSGKKVKCKAKR